VHVHIIKTYNTHTDTTTNLGLLRLTPTNLCLNWVDLEMLDYFKLLSSTITRNFKTCSAQVPNSGQLLI